MKLEPRFFQELLQNRSVRTCLSFSNSIPELICSQNLGSRALTAQLRESFHCVLQLRQHLTQSSDPPLFGAGAGQENLNRTLSTKKNSKSREKYVLYCMLKNLGNFVIKFSWKSVINESIMTVLSHSVVKNVLFRNVNTQSRKTCVCR